LTEFQAGAASCKADCDGQVVVCFGFRKNWRKGIVIIRYFHTDLSGKPTELTEATGTVQWRARHDAWGKTHVADGSRGPQQPLRFQGQYFDAETGLHYNLHRYYDPDAGRFTSQDPIGLRGGVNVYRYAPNPLGWVDPLGLQGYDLHYGGGRGYGAHTANFDLGLDQVLFCVFAYGTPDGVRGYGRQSISVARMAHDIRSSPNFQREKTLFLGVCLTGRGDRSFAQRLSDEMGTDVIAPTDVLLRNPDGTIDVLNGGFWKTCTPRR
jgi:RHS repeat-associated protein